VSVGGGAPVSVQSMTNTRTDDWQATLRQIRRLERAGCEIMRIAVPDDKAAKALPEIRHRTAMPLVADVHFDHRLALAAFAAGFDKVRINPGNIGAGWKVKEVIRAAKDSGRAIRVGVNSGSVEKAVLKKYGRATPEALVESLDRCLEPFEQLKFKSVVLSAKTTSGPDAIATSRLIARRFRYPQHLGLTEAGLALEGSVRSAAVLGTLLAEGIGDTIRVSLAADPVQEVRVAYELLAALGLRQRGPLVVACPTCGRTQVDVVGLAKKVKRALVDCATPIRVAVMGCVVNGPGEAREADFAICGGKGRGAIYVKGRYLRTVPEDRLVPELMRRIASTRRKDRTKAEAGS
jgi:(E)-4-hydroxy-3-methylbut-2-enyl-diphosphate synthase